MKLNAKGLELFDKWNHIYYDELALQRELRDDPDWTEGWCIIDDYDHIQTIEDEVGLLIFGYADCVGNYFNEWRDVFGTSPFFTDAHGQNYTLNEVENRCKEFIDGYDD